MRSRAQDGKGERVRLISGGRFKVIASLVKETKESTRDAVQTLCKM